MSTASHKEYFFNKPFIQRLRTLQKVPNNATRYEELKLEIISRVKAILSKKQTVFGYSADIYSSLREVGITPQKYLEMVVQCLQKSTRNLTDIELINGYLHIMKEFINLIKKHDQTHLNEYIQIISIYLGYHHFEKNQIICKFGERGKKAYIVLKGDIDIFLKQCRKVRMTQNDYFKYLATLIRYNEFGLLDLVLKDNFPDFPVEFGDDTKKKQKASEDKKESFQNNSSEIDINNYDSMEHSVDQSPEKIRKTKTGSIIERINYKWKAPSKVKSDYTSLVYNSEKLYKLYFPQSTGKRENINSVSGEEYVNRLNVYREVSEVEAKYSNKSYISVWIYSYIKIVTKGQGSLIGEIALTDPSALRTATMITSTDCHLGTINKKSYNLSLKFCAEKQRRQNVNYIQSFIVFSGVSLYSLSKRYFNNFLQKVMVKSNTLFTEKEPVDNIYFLRSGEYEVSIYCSLSDLNELRFIFYKKKYALKGHKIDKNHQIYVEQERYLDLLMEDNPQFKKEFHTKNKIIISDITSPDLLGMNDYLDENEVNSLFTVECKSVKGELYQLNKHFYEQIRASDQSVAENEKLFYSAKYDKVIDRIELLIKNSVDSFYDYKSKRKKFHLDYQLKMELEKDKGVTARKNLERKMNKCFISSEGLKKLKLLEKEETKGEEALPSLLGCQSVTNETVKNALFSSNVIEKSRNERSRNAHRSIFSFSKTKFPELLYTNKTQRTVSNFSSPRMMAHSPKEFHYKKSMMLISPIINLKLSKNKKLSLDSKDEINTEQNVFSVSKLRRYSKDFSERRTLNNIFNLSNSCTNTVNTATGISDVKTEHVNTKRRKKRKSPLVPSGKTEMVDIEKYSNFKRNRYLNERKKYLMKQVKTTGMKYSRVQINKK